MAGPTIAVLLSAPAVPVVILSALAACAATLHRGTSSTMGTAVVPEDELAAVNSLLNTVDELASVIGPAAGGCSCSSAMQRSRFGIRAATVAASPAALLALRTRSRWTAAAEPTNAQGELREAGRVLVGNRVVLVLVCRPTAGTVVHGVEMVALAVVGGELLGTGAEGCG